MRTFCYDGIRIGHGVWQPWNTRYGSWASFVADRDASGFVMPSFKAPPKVRPARESEPAAPPAFFNAGRRC